MAAHIKMKRTKKKKKKQVMIYVLFLVLSQELHWKYFVLTFLYYLWKRIVLIEIEPSPYPCL